MEESNSYKLFLETNAPAIEEAIDRYKSQISVNAKENLGAVIDEALASNKTRIRSILTLLGAKLVGGEVEEVLPSAVAVEFVHTGFKLFNALSDNKDSEVNEIGLEEKFGKSLVLDAGIKLLNASYPLIFLNFEEKRELAVQAHTEIVECIDATGLDRGDKTDLLSDFDSPDNLSKTILTRLALRLGAILSGADYIELTNISRFANLFENVYFLSEKGEASPVTTEKIANDAKRVLVENFSSSEARTCLIQLTDSLLKNN